MSLDLYDKELQRKLLDVFPNVVGAYTDEALSASQKGGKVKLPLISFYRVSNPIDTNSMNMPEVFRGRVTNRFESIATTTMTIPVLLTYQVDIWAPSRKVADDIYKELLFYMMRNPNLSIEVPTTNEMLDFSMILQDSENSTELSEFDTIGRLYRCTLTYEVSAKLFYTDTKGTHLIKEFDIDITN